MNVSLRQLKAFLGVAESGNFTKTSQRLHLSQAALSATIRELESQLRTRLFDRTTRAVELTEAGRAFLPTAALIVREMETAAVEVTALGRKQMTEIRLGFTPLMAAHVVPEVLERFATASPSVLVEVVDSGPVELQQLVEDGHIDAAFGAFFAKVSGLRQHPILPSQLLVACSLQEEPPEPFTWRCLTERPLIVLQADSPVQRLAEAQMQREQVSPTRRFTVNQLETAVALAEKGFGFAIIPSFAVAVCRRYAVRVRPLVPAVAFEFSQITRAGCEVSPATASFAMTFAEVMQTFATGWPAHG
jgi:DNA-binding transcriptional LysR family regulator